MDLFVLFSILITLSAFFSYLNVRTIKFPSGVGLMLMGTIVSIGLIILSNFSPDFVTYTRSKLALINFSEFLLQFLLSFLLFAGSLHIKLDALKETAKSIIIFAILSTLLSTALVGGGIYLLVQAMGGELPLVYCFLFGALISPTDPVAVVGILSKSSLPPRIQVNIAGESLFNDGIGVVIFTVILEVARVGMGDISPLSVGVVFLQEAGGGLLLGFAIGFVGFRMMKRIDHFQSEILISLAMVMGGYSLSHFLHVSGPLAMVVAGLITGNQGREKAMSLTTRDYLGKFWEVLDDILNAILFMLIGLEIVVIDFQPHYLLLGLATVLLVLVARYASLWIPVQAFFLQKEFRSDSIRVMTWGGLRGGISIALALSIPLNAYKPMLVSITFVVVLFSILVQGMTVERMVLGNARRKARRDKKG